MFHAVTYLLTVAGVVLVWRARSRIDASPASRILLGGVLKGWSVFNLVEGILNHHFLGIHHVWPAGPGSVLL